MHFISAFISNSYFQKHYYSDAYNHVDLTTLFPVEGVTKGTDIKDALINYNSR